MRPKVLICVLCGAERTNWINPALTLNLMWMLRDARFEVHYHQVHDARPWEFARNQAINVARSIGADWLVSFDNDNFVYGDRTPLDVLAEAGDKDIIGLSYGVGTAGTATTAPTYRLCPFPPTEGKPDGDFWPVNAVPGGVLMIRRTVWEKIPRGPWFRWQHADNELLATDPQQTIGEDFNFCKLAGEHGLQVWTHSAVVAGHYRTADLTNLVGALMRMG